MFSNFDEVFNKKSRTKVVPKEVLHALNNGLPEGISYQDHGDGFCTLEPTGEHEDGYYKFNATFTLPDDIKRFLIDNKNADLNQALYLSQRSISFEADGKNRIELEVGGRIFSAEEMFMSPMKERIIGSGNWTIKPQPFPKPFTLNMSGRDFEKEVLMQRVPYLSLDELKFESTNLGILDFSYIVNIKHDGVVFNMKVNVEKSSSIKEIVDAYVLMERFMNGEILLFGELNDDSKKVDENFLESKQYWTDLYELEKLLGVSFKLVFPIEGDDQLWIDALLISIMHNRSYRSNEQYNSFSFNVPRDVEIKTKEDEIVMNMRQEIKLEILGTSIHLSSIVVLSNIKIDNVELVDKNEKRITLVPYSSDKKIQRVVKHFASTADADAEQEVMNNDTEDAKRTDMIDIYLASKGIYEELFEIYSEATE